MAFTSPESRLVLALDLSDRGRADELVAATEGLVGVYKIGLEFAMTGGLDYAGELVAAGRAVFLDMKLLDIGNTVAGAVRGAGAIGAEFVTVHAYPQALEAAVAARPDGLKIVAVTVLTSYDDKDLAAAGYLIGADVLVGQRLSAAAALGADAVVCSPNEAKAAGQSGLLVITPGVRLAADGKGGQKRVATPDAAIAAGADAVVVGRPIAGAKDPRAAAERYVAAIKSGLEQREAASAGRAVADHHAA